MSRLSDHLIEFNKETARIRKDLKSPALARFLVVVAFCFIVLLVAHSIFTPNGEILDMSGAETIVYEGSQNETN